MHLPPRAVIGAVHLLPLPGAPRAGPGWPADPDRLRQVRAAVPGVPVWVASGVDADNAALFRDACDAAMVGTALHRDRVLSAPLERDRVRAVVEAFGG